ncbi:MAG: hypothetical protein ACOYMB_02420 [Patescibacteria group bacterium]
METEKIVVTKVAKKKLIPVFDLFENSWKMYRDNFKSLISISLYSLFGLIAIIIGVALVSGLVVFLSMRGQGSIVGTILIVALIALLALAALAAAIWYSTRSKIGTYLLIKNNFSSVKDSWNESKEIFWPFFWLSLLSAVLVILWAILLIIPGIIFAIFYSFAILLFIFEGQKGMTAIKASKDLVKGYWWAIFGRFIFVGFALYLLSLLLGLPVNATEGNQLLSGVFSIFNSVVMFVVSPFLYVYSVLLFKNLKEVKK